jgi:hypothetical protein
MILKGKKVKKLTADKRLPEQTTERIKAALERLKDKNKVVLCKVPSSKPGKTYDIVLGSNNTVHCECDGFKYRSECRHMERFRLEIKPQTLL